MGKHKLNGQVVVVTGGAAGIGRAISEKLAKVGARVAIGDRDAEAAAGTASEIGATGYPLDVTDEHSYTHFLETVTAELGPVDVLINNAGVMWVGAFDTEPPSATDAMFAVNVGGVIRGVRLVAPTMRQRGSGHILTIASAASKLAPPGEASYAATKHAVLGYLTGVREELHGTGVTISMIMPGVVDTALAAGTDTGAAKLLRPDDVAKAVVKTLVKPQFQTTIPSYVGPLVAGAGLLPQFARDLLLRQMVPNQVKAIEGADRSGYEKGAL